MAAEPYISTTTNIAPRLVTALTHVSDVPIATVNETWIPIGTADKIYVHVKWVTVDEGPPRDVPDSRSAPPGGLPRKNIMVKVQWSTSAEVPVTWQTGHHVPCLQIPRNEAATASAEVAPNATTSERHRIGAVLRVKQIPAWHHLIINPLDVEVGDKIKLLAHEVDGGFPLHPHRRAVVQGRNMRTELEGRILLESFFEVGHRMMCACTDQRCRCVYKDYWLSKVSG